MAHEKLNGKISILFEHEGLSIKVEDELSGCKFIEIQLNAEQTCQALSRLSCTPCQMIINHPALKVIGKKQEWKDFDFEYPSIWSRLDRNAFLLNITALAKKKCPKGWESDCYFNGQDSFYCKNKKYYAHTTIRRWVEEI